MNIRLLKVSIKIIFNLYRLSQKSTKVLIFQIDYLVFYFIFRICVESKKFLLFKLYSFADICYFVKMQNKF